MRRAGLAVLLGCGASTATTKAPVTSAEPVPPPVLVAPLDRLPRTFTPTGYRVRLALEPKALHGSIEITGTLREPTRVIWLHGDHLAIEKATARAGGETITLGATPPRTDSLVALYADRPLAAGTWTLALDYTGAVEDKGVIDPRSLDPDAVASRPDDAFGVFSEVLDDRRYWFTNSEPTYARRIFPCLDEPDRKVPWQVTLDVPRTFVAASNTPIVRESPLPRDHKRVEFAPTRPIPSYLVAFAAGPFEIVDGGTSPSGVPVRILGQPGRVAGAPWALHVARDLLTRMEAYTAIAYPYGKLDFVAVPKTGTHWVAMENPGLITFGASYLPATSRREAMWRLVAGHELAHQWFGDLVTPAWWDDVWLNESFAVWLQEKIDQQLEPAAEGPVFDAFRRSWQLARRSRMRAPLDDTRVADDIAPYMDGYRGEPVLRMFEEVAGPAAFQRAVRGYLAAHAHGTATAAAFTSALETASGRKLGGAFAAYLDREGVPTLEPALECGASHQLIVRSSKTEWPVPACIAYDADGRREETCTIVSDAETRVPLRATRCPRWVLPNANASGLYTIDWSKQLAPILAHGWSFLTEPEKTMLLVEARRDEAASVALASRLLSSPDPTARGIAAHALASFDHDVPADLAAAYRTRVLAAIPELATPLREREYPELGQSLLAGLAGRASITRDATALVDQIATLPGPVVQVVLRVATAADPKQVDRLLEAAKVQDHTRWHLVDAIARAPGSFDRLEREPKLFANFVGKERITILTTRCAPASQARAMALAAKALADAPPDYLDVAAKSYQQCLDRRAKLAPVFRAWLKPRR